jgi:hypothetical protein
MAEGTDTMTPLWRGVVVLRLLCAAVAAAAIVVHDGGYARPQLGVAVLAAILAWTAVVTVGYSRDTGRRLAMIVADLAVTLVLMGASVWALSADQLAGRTPLLTTVWASGPVLAAAVHLGRIGGVAAAAAVSLANWSVRGLFSTDIARDTVLLLGTGFVLGLAAGTARRAGEQLRRAARAEAAAAERERLASAAPPDQAGTGDADLGPEMQLLAGPRVAVSVPAGPVPLPAGDVEELVAVVTEALSHTAQRARPDAKSWVLVEDLGDEIVVTVCEDGDGMVDGLVDETPTGAEVSGRMGVARSVRGRVADLGGTLSLDSGPGGGTGWQLRLVRTRAGTPR